MVGESSSTTDHSPAKIVPVIDLLGGVVVRGIAGNRSQYRPLVSALAKDASPQAVAQGLKAAGAKTIYVADLDAIQRPDPEIFPAQLSTAYTAIAAAGLHLWLDAGIGSVKELAALQSVLTGCGLSCDFIVGLETLRSEESLAELLSVLGPERLLFSLDMKAGEPLTLLPSLQKKVPLAIATQAILAGVTRMILLDLADVGMAGGTRTLSLCQALHQQFPRVQLIAGGGVRSPADLVTLAQQGCTATLVASALHDGHLPLPQTFY